MADYIEIALAAINRTPKKNLEADDRHVPGLYSLMVKKGLPLGIMACAALDRFHSDLPISVLDDFCFIVFDPMTNIMIDEADDQEDYENADHANDVVLLSRPRHLGLYLVTVKSVAKDGSAATRGTVKIVAANKKEAGEHAKKHLWDTSLDAANCTPRCDIEILDL